MKRRKSRSRPWDDERMAGNTGCTVEEIHKRRVEGNFDYKELTLPYGAFAGEDATPAPVALPWMITIPLAKCICGNCVHFKAGSNQCDYIVAQKEEISIACIHIWDKGNYVLAGGNDGSADNN